VDLESTAGRDGRESVNKFRCGNEVMATIFKYFSKLVTETQLVLACSCAAVLKQ